MRKAVCCLFLACAAAFGQSTPAQNPNAMDENAERAKSAVEALRQKMEHLNQVNAPGPQKFLLPQGAPVFRPRVCAIPLLRVIPPGTTDKMTFVRPPVQPRENSDTVKVPAPACDARLFTNGPAITSAPVPGILRPAPRQ
jgi:hypothetical protein